MVRGKFLIVGLAAALAFPGVAQSQSPTALAGMEAYNRGDIVTAYPNLREAADANDPEALVNLGYLHARGQGVRVDQKEALSLYQRSANQGSSEGMNALGYKYSMEQALPLIRNVACIGFALRLPRAIRAR